ncbi:glycoside hydrolase family 26 protein [Parafrankia sp. FMc2]|uniref:glycoside hydrolase family 26 protein n=1 Tax=Parafrankia sp. FMc2 TaxID=3233196 RepID=UPI0034D61B30
MAFVAVAVGWTLAPEGGDGDSSAVVEASAIDPSDLRRIPPGTTSTGGPDASPSPVVSLSPSPVPATATAQAPPPTTAAPPPPPAPRAALGAAGSERPAGGGGGRVPGGMSGVYANSMATVRSWEALRGSPVNVVLTFSDRGSWETITHPWVGGSPEKFSTFPGTWVISQPFYPTGQGSLAACASGAYNSHWAEFGRWLVSKGRPATIVRLAWEFNGNWFEWSVRGNPGAYASCFRQVVSAVRSTNPQARFDWALNAHSTSPWEAYPGDEYVDIIGVDTYDQWPASTSPAEFDKQCGKPVGLCSAIRFARDHGKQFSVPEWGLVGRSDTEAGRAGQAGGDNPVYIQKMYETFRANADVLAYETYFNDSRAGNVHSSLVSPNENPNSAGVYASLW